MTVYDLPFGKGRKFASNGNAFTNALIGGWTVSGLMGQRKGTLIQLVTPGNPLGNGVIFAPQTKANIGTGPIRTGIDRTTLDPNNPSTRWFNASAFTAAPAYTLGNAAFFHNEFRQPAVWRTFQS